MMVKQRTITRSVSIEGKGLHSGKVSKVVLKPADAGKGLFFKRIDLPNEPIIPADAMLVTDTSRGTSIEKDCAKISTIEHLMASLYANYIDNIEIDVDCEEVPILDGSAKYWIELLEQAGIEEQDKERKYYSINEPIHYKDKDIEYWALPSEDFSVTSTIDFSSSLIGTQIAELDNLNSFNKDFACCRTFVFLSEIMMLVQHNLIKGGDLNNAIIFVDSVLEEKEREQIAKFFNKNTSDVKVERGILNNVDLRFHNEPARHKLLDFIGDLALVGIHIKGHFIIKCPGHSANNIFAKKIKKIMEEKNIPTYDPNKPAVFDIVDIKKRLPHRFPMLLIDKIIEVGEDYVIGLKNVTGNEDFFNGHFPEEPVMPGVLIVEALGQTGGMLVLKDVSPEEKYNTYFMKFEEVKFRNKVVPGDTLILKLTQQGPVRRGCVTMKGVAYVGNKVCVEATMMAMVSKA
ncbi:MAG: bifunctional UDP-3-O-[Bacteroidales bacterium]|nr:bifunctional UDP-3-O-[3-hydroxymyristoyl] N-acetylglucosamine deacetylase/3-hydroxyacyl-ACP dehydratase [Bacteroidales bacterium]